MRELARLPAIKPGGLAIAVWILGNELRCGDWGMQLVFNQGSPLPTLAFPTAVAERISSGPPFTSR